MPEEYESEPSKFRFPLVTNLLLRFISIFSTLPLVVAVVGSLAWIIKQFFPLTAFEVGVLSIGLWGIVLLLAIYHKIRLIEQAIAQEEWDEEYEFYTEEEQELFEPEEPNDAKTRSNQGNVIHLEQKFFSKKQDKK